MYLLYVNGSCVGRGPVRAWKGHVGIDSHDIGPKLVPGSNVISVLVHSLGVEDVGGYPESEPGFLFHGRIGKTELSTGVAPWQACRLTCWKSDAPRLSLYAGFNEDLDLRKYEPAVWENGSDQAEWRAAVPVPDAEKRWPHKEERMIPFLREATLAHMKLLAVGEYNPDRVENDGLAECMARESHHTVKSGRVRIAGDPWPVRITGGRPIYLILDAGRITSGVVEVDILARGGEELRIGYADQCRMEERSFLEGRDRVADDPTQNTFLILNPTHGGTNNSVDRFVLREGANRWKGLFNLRGFRYLKMSFSNLKGEVAVRRVRPCEITYPVNTIHRFETSDTRLNKIWETSLLTTRLCMSDTFMDNPSRERQQYGGDAYLQSLCAHAYYGDIRLWRQFLRLYSQGTRDDGAIQAGGPWCWNQIIPAWTLLWIESIGEFARCTGDRGVLHEHADSVRRAIEWFFRLEGQDGLLSVKEKLGWAGAPGGVLWNFIDWQGIDGQLRGEEARLTLNCIYCAALQTAARIMRAVGNTDSSCAYHKRRERIAGTLCSLLSDPASVASRSEHVIVYATLAGLVRERMKAIAESAAAGTTKSDMIYMFFTLKALEQEGHDSAVLSLVRRIFGGMLDEGATTFSEATHARLNPGQALCQGYGGVAGYFLPRIVTGIREIRPREKTLVVRPRPEGVEWARSTVQCPDGEIAVSVQSGSGGCETRTSVPNGWRILS